MLVSVYVHVRMCVREQRGHKIPKRKLCLSLMTQTYRVVCCEHCLSLGPNYSVKNSNVIVSNVDRLQEPSVVHTDNTKAGFRDLMCMLVSSE